MFRDTAAGKTGTLTHVGLKTFVGPGLKNEYLFYASQSVDFAEVRATCADKTGNTTFEKECKNGEDSWNLC